MKVCVDQVHLLLNEWNRTGYESRFHRFVNQMGDCFAEVKKVVGSIPTGAHIQSSAQSCSFFFSIIQIKCAIDLIDQRHRYDERNIHLLLLINYRLALIK